MVGILQSDRLTIIVIHRKYGVETIIGHSSTSHTGAKLLERRKNGSYLTERKTNYAKRITQKELTFILTHVTYGRKSRAKCRTICRVP